MRKAMNDMNALFIAKQSLPTGRAEDDLIEMPRGLAAQGARCMENLSKMLFATEDRVTALENTVLTLMREHAYANGGSQANPTDARRDESWHVPAMEDLHALEAQTGVAGHEGPERMRVTVPFSFMPI